MQANLNQDLIVLSSDEEKAIVFEQRKRRSRQYLRPGVRESQNALPSGGQPSENVASTQFAKVSDQESTPVPLGDYNFRTKRPALVENVSKVPRKSAVSKKNTDQVSFGSISEDSQDFDLKNASKTGPG